MFFILYFESLWHCYCSQEIRYFEENFDITKVLESTVSENPLDVKSWILLAQKTLASADNDESQGKFDEKENHALNILSRALEANANSEVQMFLFITLLYDVLL